MILNQSQAKAAYDAMCALNNVSENSGVTVSFVGSFEGEMSRFTCIEKASGVVEISRGPAPSWKEVETYLHQAEFATAYGITA